MILDTYVLHPYTQSRSKKSRKRRRNAGQVASSGHGGYAALIGNTPLVCNQTQL